MAIDPNAPLDCVQVNTKIDESYVRDCNNKVAKLVTDECNKAILEQILIALGGQSGTAFFDDDIGVTDTIGTPKTILSSSVPVATTRSINKVVVTSRASGRFEIKIAGVKVGSGKTGPSEMNVEFVFSPVRVATATQLVEVDFTMLYGKVGQDVEVFLFATDTV